jgi:hypothetical protein
MASISWVQQLPQALRAGSHVGRDKLIASYFLSALPNLKAQVETGSTILDLDVGNPGQRWRLLPQLRKEAIQGQGSAFYLDVNSPRVIEDPAGQPESVG